MRPRISQHEAAYLVEVLTAQHEEIKQKFSNVEQLERDYTRIIYDLKHPIQVEYSNKGYFAGHRLIGTQETLSLVRLAQDFEENIEGDRNTSESVTYVTPVTELKNCGHCAHFRMPSCEAENWENRNGNASH